MSEGFDKGPKVSGELRRSRVNKNELIDLLTERQKGYNIIFCVIS